MREPMRTQYNLIIEKVKSYNEDEGMAIALGDVNNALQSLDFAIGFHAPNIYGECVSCVSPNIVAIEYPCAFLRVISNILDGKTNIWAI